MRTRKHANGTLSISSVSQEELGAAAIDAMKDLEAAEERHRKAGFGFKAEVWVGTVIEWNLKRMAQGGKKNV